MAIGFLLVMAGYMILKKLSDRKKKYVVKSGEKVATRTLSGITIIVGACLILTSLAGLVNAISTQENSDLVVTVSSSSYSAVVGEETFFTITAEVENTGVLNYTDLVMVLHTPAELIWQTWSSTTGDITVEEKGSNNSNMRPTDGTWTFSIQGLETHTLTAIISTRAHESNNNSNAPAFCWTSAGSKILLEFELGGEAGIIEVEVSETDPGDPGEGGGGTGGCEDQPPVQQPADNMTFNKSYEHLILPRIDQLDFSEIPDVLINREEDYTAGSIHNTVTTVTGTNITISPAWKIITVSSVRVSMFIDTTGFEQYFNHWALTFKNTQTGEVYGSMTYTEGTDSLTLTIAVEVPTPGTRTVVDVCYDFNIKQECSWNLVEKFLPWDSAIIDSGPSNYVNENVPTLNEGETAFHKFVISDMIQVGAQNSVSNCTTSEGLGELPLSITREESAGNVWLNTSGLVSGIELTDAEFFYVPYFNESIHSVAFCLVSVNGTALIENMTLHLTDSAGASVDFQLFSSGTANGSVFTWEYQGTLSASLSLQTFYTGIPGTFGNTSADILEIF